MGVIVAVERLPVLLSNHREQRGNAGRRKERVIHGRVDQQLDGRTQRLRKALMVVAKAAVRQSGVERLSDAVRLEHPHLRAFPSSVTASASSAVRRSALCRPNA